MFKTCQEQSLEQYSKNKLQTLEILIVDMYFGVLVELKYERKV